MRYLVGLLILTLGFMPLANSQSITSEHSFTVRKYSIFEQGFPFGVVRGHKGTFTFLEYYIKDVNKRRATNWYLQNFSTSTHQENWFKSVTTEGFDPIEIEKLMRMDKGYVVTGYKYNDELKRNDAVARFFRGDGKPLSSEVTVLSKYDKKAKKGFEDTFTMSPSGAALLWMGTDGVRYMFSAWDAMGKEIWGQELELPYVVDKYEVTDVVVEDKGKPIMLLESTKRTGTAKDTLFPPIIARYSYKAEKFVQDTLNFDSLYLVNGHLKMLENGNVAVVGVLSNDSPEGIMNGGKRGESQILTHIFMKRYELTTEITEAAGSINPIPEDWKEKYKSPAKDGKGEKGSNFGPEMVLADDWNLVFLMEEHYTSKDKFYYYDIGAVGFNLQSGKMDWSHLIEKKQRDRSGVFLSFTPGIARRRLNLVYLTERGARGKMVCSKVDLKTGKLSMKDIESNEDASYLFFPKNSGMVSETEMVLIGMGDPSSNDYKIMTITF